MTIPIYEEIGRIDLGACDSSKELSTILPWAEYRSVIVDGLETRLPLQCHGMSAGSRLAGEYFTGELRMVKFSTLLPAVEEKTIRSN